MTTVPAAPSSDGIDLSQNGFWAAPLEQRHAAFARLRELPQPLSFALGDAPFATPDDRYYALVRHADVTEASRHPELFSGRKARAMT